MPRPATRPATRWTRWSASPASCRPASPSSGPASRARSGSRARRRRSCSRSRCWRCSCACRRCTRAGRSRSRCCSRCRSACSARCSARRLRGMPNDVFFKVGLITVIGLSAKNAILIIEFAKDLVAAGQGRDRGDAAGGAPALPSDPDDLDRLHPRRAAAGRLVGRRLGQPARDRHRRDGRDDHGDAARDLLRAGVLRRRAPHLQGPRRSPPPARCPTPDRPPRAAPLAKDAGHA